MGAEGAKIFENQGVANLLNNLYPWVGVGACLAKTSDLRVFWEKTSDLRVLGEEKKGAILSPKQKT